MKTLNWLKKLDNKCKNLDKMKNRTEIVSSNVGNIVIEYDARYHMYIAYLESAPSVCIETRYKSTIVETFEREVEEYFNEINLV